MAVYYKNVGNTMRVIEERAAAKPKKSVVKVKRRRAAKFVYQNDHKHKLPVLTVVTLSLVFAGAAGIAAAACNVSVTNRYVISLKNELRDAQSQNNALEEEVNRYDDVTSMRETAQEKLGMSEPKPYQILHINVPEENYVEYNK